MLHTEIDIERCGRLKSKWW